MPAQSSELSRRIGILTYHKVFNYGAFMQAYALSQALTKRFPQYTVEIIDYYPRHERRRYWLNVPAWTLYRRGVKATAGLFVKYGCFMKSWKHLPLSPWRVISDQDTRLARKVNARYDIVIAGSDAIFNDAGFKRLSPFFMHDITQRKYSCAVSAHGLRYREKDEKSLQYIRESFSALRIAGVRDAHTEAFIRYCCPAADPVFCCDPTLLLSMDFRTESLERKMRKAGIRPEDKVILLMLKDDKLAPYIRQWFGKDYKIVSIVNQTRGGGTYLYNLTPFEWAKIFSYAAFAVTDYFHGTLLCLKNHTPVIAVDVFPENELYPSKLEDVLLTRLNLPDFYFRSETLDDPAVLETLHKQCLDNIANPAYPSRIKQAIGRAAASFDVFCAMLTADLDKESER